MRIIVIPNEPNPNMTGRHYALSKAFVGEGNEVFSIAWDQPQRSGKLGFFGYIKSSLTAKQYTYEDFTVCKVRRLPYFWPYINRWIFKAQLRRLHTKHSIDMIVAQNYTNETGIPKEIPFIYDLADDYAAPADVYGSFMYKLAFKVLGVRRTMKQQLRQAVAVTAVSDTLCSYAKQHNDNVIKLPNGVEKTIIKQILRNKRIACTNPHSVFYVSGFGAWSRPLDAMRAVQELRSEFPDISLTLVGEGSEVAKMQQFIKDNNAETYIHYLGHIHDRKKVFSLIKQHAIGLNISDKNAWRDAAHPMKVMDYSALGKKVVSTDLDGVRTLNLPNVFLFSDTDKKQSLKTVLRRALKDAKDYQEVSASVLENYNWSTLVKRLSNIRTVPVPQLTVPQSQVVHVTPSYPPALGGLERVVQALARTQAAQGYDVTVVASDHNANQSAETEEFAVHRLQGYVLANTTIMPALLLQLLRVRRGDVVHLHITQAYTPEIVWLAAKIKGFRYIAHIHLDVPPSGPAGFLLKLYKPLILKRVLKGAGAVIVFSETQKEAVVAKYDIAADHVAVVPNGVEDQFFYDKDRSLPKKPNLLFVGRLNYQKNVAHLLQALEGVSDRFRTTIVGDGELEPELKKSARNLGLKNVTFAGRADGEALLNYYRSADIFVLPSEREGMPLVLLEAMAMGLPVIATDVTGSRDIVKDRENGLLVPYGNIGALREALLQLTSDKGMYTAMSKAARGMAKEFNWNKIAARFTSLYKSVASDVHSPRQVALPSLYAPLLVAANAAYLLHNILGWSITLGFFLLVPGYLLLNLMKHGLKSRWEIASLSLGLSILVLMVGGLALNSLHSLGLSRPLSTMDLFIVLDAIVVALLVSNRRKRVVLPRFKFKPSIERVVFTATLTSLPLLAIGGAIRLNNGASNILTMVLFAAIPTLVLLFVWRKNLKPLYPYALFAIGLSILFSNSLRGWYITGHDIHHEFAVFQNVAARGFWQTTTSSSDPYNACLSITILPVILAKITTISAAYIYKIVFQILFAFGLLPIFYLVRRFSTDLKAFISAFVFVTFPVFLNDMPFLNRQEIAFIFFALLMFITFAHMARRTKTILTLLFLSSLILSHYSSSYVTVALLLLAWLFHKLWIRRSQDSDVFHMPVLNLSIILVALLLTFAWNAQITSSTSNLKNAIVETVSGLIHHSSVRNGSSQYSLFTPGPRQTPQQEFTSLANKEDNQAQYVAPAELPVTAIGRYISHVVNIKMLNQALHGLIAKVFQAITLLGVVVYLIKRWKHVSRETIYFGSLALAFTTLLIILTLLPQLSVDYDVTRLFQQGLIVLALPMVMALEFIFMFLGRFRLYAAVIFLCLLFLDLSGFIPQLTGDYLPQLPLNNTGFYYDYFYTHKSDIVSSDWLAINRNQSKAVHMDTTSSAYPLQYWTNVGLVSSSSKGYLYQGYTNVHDGAYRLFLSSGYAEYTDMPATANSSLVYANQDSRVYAR